LIRSVPLDGGTPIAGNGGDPATSTIFGVLALSDLLDDAPPTAELPCRQGDADLWFGETPAELEQAKALCADCPVRAACLAGALRRREPWGVWGGEIFERGQVIARKRPRGRPSKADLARDEELAIAG
jgi:WhiB family redox-sensing transcriptional regulator